MGAMPSWKKLLVRGNTAAFSFVLALLSISVVLILYYTQNSFLEAFEAKTYDLRFKIMRGPIQPSPNIGIIAIDDKSIAELGRFPWSRDHYARLIDRLAAAQAKAVMFDVFFPEPESAEHDRQFAAATKRAGNVVLAVAFDFDKDGQVKSITRSLPEIERGAVGVGHINQLPDDDGVIRRNPLLLEKDGKQIPSLGLMAAMLALGETKFAAEDFDIALGDRRIPVDGENRMWINYVGGPGVYPRYSFADVLKGRIPASELKGKILFVGATALGIYDMRVTPFNGNTPGVELHATVADDIISERFIRQGGIEALIDMTFIIVLGALAYFLTTRLNLYGAIPAMIVLVSGYIWFTNYMFSAGQWINIIYPVMSAIVALLVGGSFRYLVLERSAREMRSMFSSYLSPKLVARLEKDPEAARIGGDNKEVTVLFTDIKSFTTFSEAHPPQEVVSRLNEYLGAMVQVIEQHDGTIDKFIGDGIMAYWGAPLSQPDHARLAIDCIKAINQRMNELRAKWLAIGMEPFTIRGGLQSGEVVAGNIGLAGKKMEYTVIGDTVNQAARLEGTAKYYGINYLVGEETYKKTRDICRYRELDKIRVVGKQMPVTIYEPLEGLSKLDVETAKHFEEALLLYRAKTWAKARSVFNAVLETVPDDKPSKIFIERCEYFMKNPPEEHWDGVFNRAEK
ncbi:CHASE2 domain-containing protein [Sideroxydans lithotrophicus]|uniref:Adenylate/guanylate cyclase with Chase sensor n=1 Tax=Sideroxydans lithotrophicus (strain ES-1) TaxID=580332 RepID=D5CLA6_SIDLE|nr:adenylate/guanylate cyclase domain-containing protein [Sideroxydans lithotrophicus]ADE10494.1 adenylate/guanylate cyclase with Chase sensor [Sideroxydans lithotrophicus ES-1]